MRGSRGAHTPTLPLVVGQSRGSHQNSRAFFFRSFRFQRARRSNSSTLIPNTSWNSSGDKCLLGKKGGTPEGRQLATLQQDAGPPEAGPR